MHCIGSLSTEELTFDPSSHAVSCVSCGGPVNTVTWSRNGDPITSSTSSYQLSQSLTSGVTSTSTFLHTLTITGRDAEDYNGTFSCTVSNSRGPAPVQSLEIHSKMTSIAKLHIYISGGSKMICDFEYAMGHRYVWFVPSLAKCKALAN